MSHALVSFLGRVPGSQERYETVLYDVPGGGRRRCALFAHALREDVEPDDFIVLGTASSMWEHLSDDVDARVPAEMRALLERIYEARTEGRLSQQALDELAAQLTEVLGCRVALGLIPDAHDAAGQLEVVARLAELTHGVSALSFDVTHGFRHLPLLAFVAALYLRALRPGLEIRGVWYASWQSGDAAARVSDLAPLMQIVDWTNAVQRLDWMGDYGAVAPLLEDSVLRERLTEAAFRERTHQGQVADALKVARSRLAEHPLQGAGALFEPLLRERIGWIDGNFVAHQIRQAWAALERGDYVMAGLRAYEAFVSHLTAQLTDDDPAAIFDPDQREHALDRYEGSGDRRLPSFNMLRLIRNRLAHGPAHAGTRERPEVARALASRHELERTLRRCMRELIPLEQ